MTEFTAEGHRALLQAVNEFCRNGSEAAFLILARAAELTAQNSAADAIVGHKWRASPAKDGGEQAVASQPTHWRYKGFLDGKHPWRLIETLPPENQYSVEYGFTLAQPLASQMPASHDAPFEKAWYEISNLLIGNYAQAVSTKEVHEKQVMPKLQALLESQMRPQSAVQGWIPTWAWRQAFGEWFGGKLGQGSFHRCFDSIESRARELAAAPQPPQGEGA